MNAQKRNIDVWLIYKCAACDSTYNLTILSRTKPERIEKELFVKFSENDEDLSRRYAFSAETGRKNEAELDYSSVEYEIRHDNISVNDILNAEEEIVAFKIRAPFEFGLKLSAVVRHCFGLSANLFRQLTEAEAIFTLQGYPLKKHKVKDGDIVVVSKEKLQYFFCPK